MQVISFLQKKRWKTISVTIGNTQFMEFMGIIDKEGIIDSKAHLEFDYPKEKLQIIATIKCYSEEDYCYVKDKLEANLTTTT